MATASLLDQTPPADIEAEMCVLGSMLRDREVVGDVLQILQPDFFYRESHVKIYQAMLDCYDQQRGIDVVLLREELERRGQLEQIGGPAYLVDVMGAAPSAANAEYYAQIVRDKALVRNLIRAASDILRDAYSGQHQADELLDHSESRIFQIAEKKGSQQTHRLEDLVTFAFNVIADRAESGGQQITGLATGWPELDEITSGLQKGELIIIAARPSMGKTAFALNLMEHVCVQEKAGAAFFSLEQSKEELAQRMLCTRARIDGSKLRRGMLSKMDMGELIAAADVLSQAKLFVDDTPGQTPLEIRAKARRLKTQHDIALVAVDYMQLMDTRGRSESRQQEIAEISRGLKLLARELEVPVVALSQLNRSVETRSADSHKPRMSDLRESGAIEQDADVIILLHRDEMYDPEAKPGEAEIIVAKQRNGPTGSVHLSFLKKYMRFEPLSTVEEPF